ncbi:hypothetical protein SL034_004231 [Vibrio harveyi]|uniref:hypothetical protein n=1 Tax=Vibrio harveyi group TaxID=717610 RepID=UPI0013B0579E|nr:MULTISPECIES: hypothetical protein [Vibrio harveyi group]ELY1989143.1 hypothetical protein [Vibrio harveyi]WCP78920.1 hypothetical protein PPW95_25260 [Vibrio parahaemolyticus]WHP52992.1 hypothetical protein QMY43_25050 [Vibrio parahaemolyticus]
MNPKIISFVLLVALVVAVYMTGYAFVDYINNYGFSLDSSVAESINEFDEQGN